MNCVIIRLLKKLIWRRRANRALREACWRWERLYYQEYDKHQAAIARIGKLQRQIYDLTPNEDPTE